MHWLWLDFLYWLQSILLLQMIFEEQNDLSWEIAEQSCILIACARENLHKLQVYHSEIYRISGSTNIHTIFRNHKRSGRMFTAPWLAWYWILLTSDGYNFLYIHPISNRCCVQALRYDRIVVKIGGIYVLRFSAAVTATCRASSKHTHPNARHWFIQFRNVRCCVAGSSPKYDWGR